MGILEGFWDTVRHMTEAERRRFLFFLTASDRVKGELDSDMRRAISDLGLLSMAKRNAQSEIFTASQAKRRFQGGYSSNSSDEGSTSLTPLDDMRAALLKDSVIGGSSESTEKDQSNISLDATVLQYEMDKLKEKSVEVLKSVGLSV